MNYNYNDVLEYIVNAISDLEREINMALRDMNKYRCPLDQARCGDEIEDAITEAISDYEWDNDDQFEEGEVLNDILSEKDFEDVLFDALDYKNKNEHVNEAYFNKSKRNVYDDGRDANKYETQPVMKDVNLYDIRQRVEEILRNCNENDYAIAKKQTQRLYKFVDAMINQGFNIY